MLRPVAGLWLPLPLPRGARVPTPPEWGSGCAPAPALLPRRSRDITGSPAARAPRAGRRRSSGAAKSGPIRSGPARVPRRAQPRSSSRLTCRPTGRAAPEPFVHPQRLPWPAQTAHNGAAAHWPGPGTCPAAGAAGRCSSSERRLGRGERGLLGDAGSREGKKTKKILFVFSRFKMNWFSRTASYRSPSH